LSFSLCAHLSELLDVEEVLLCQSRRKLCRLKLIRTFLGKILEGDGGNNIPKPSLKRLYRPRSVKISSATSKLRLRLRPNLRSNAV
jgi:hypothetical protein